MSLALPQNLCTRTHPNMQADGSSGSLGSLVGRASGAAAAAAAAKPKNTLPLLTSTVKMDSEDAGMRCSFR